MQPRLRSNGGFELVSGVVGVFGVMEAVNLLPNGWRKQSLRDLAIINYGKLSNKILSNDERIPVVGTGGVERYGIDWLHEGESIILGRKGTIDKVAYVVMLQTEAEFSLLGVSGNLSRGVGKEDEAETIQRRRGSGDLSAPFQK